MFQHGVHSARWPRLGCRGNCRKSDGKCEYDNDPAGKHGGSAAIDRVAFHGSVEVDDWARGGIWADVPSAGL